MSLDQRDLRYFETIAELGHLRHAAEQLCLTQPALSKCIKRLEQALGAPLFERQGRGIVLTAVGHQLWAQARKLNRIADNALREVREFARGQSGLVRIGCGPVTADALMPGICDLVLRQMPGVRLKIMLGMNYSLREQLRQGDIDAIFGLVPNGDDEFLMHGLMDDTVVVAASSSHPLARRRRLAIDDLAPYQWLLPIAAVASRQWLDQVFINRNLAPPKALIEANTIPSLLNAITKSELLCFVSRHTLAQHALAPPLLAEPQLLELPIEATTLQRRLGLTLQRASLSPAVGRFVALLREHADQLRAGS